MMMPLSAACRLPAASRAGARRATHFARGAAGRVLLFLLLAAAPRAEEVTVRNDSFEPSNPAATIVGGFNAGEGAAVWLTMPCDGDIVALQVLWGTNDPGAVPSIERALRLFQGGTFPTPGDLILEVEGPQLAPGRLNEFRFLDESQIFPIRQPVTRDQVIVLAIEFDNPAFDPSITRDQDGCQSGRNALYAENPSGPGYVWLDFCTAALLQGDLILRVVVDCAEPEVPEVAFVTATSSVGEADGLASVEVRLSQPAPAGGATVAFAATGGTATGAGTDYTLLGSGTLTFAQNESSKLIGLLVAQDTTDEPDETIILTLSNPAGCTLGAQRTHTVTLADDDAPPPPGPSGVRVR